MTISAIELSFVENTVTGRRPLEAPVLSGRAPPSLREEGAYRARETTTWPPFWARRRVDVLGPQGGDQLGDREQVGIVAQQLAYLVVEAGAWRANLHGATTPCSSRFLRSTASARWRRIFAAASLTSNVRAISRNEQP